MFVERVEEVQEVTEISNSDTETVSSGTGSDGRPYKIHIYYATYWFLLIIKLFVDLVEEKPEGPKSKKRRKDLGGTSKTASEPEIDIDILQQNSSLPVLVDEEGNAS